MFSNKSPPTNTVTSFLINHGKKSGLRRVIIDQGNELAMSVDFHQCISDTGCSLEATGAGASFQNRIIEQPHQTLADMMRIMLSGANLKLEYWSHTIRHAVYIKKLLPHQSLPKYITPFLAFTNRRPNLTHIRVFGSHVTIKQPRVGRYKLDTDHITSGIFFEFSSIN